MAASPQKEHGHIDIANEIAEALMKTNISAYQYRILWAIWRKTYGWHKKEDWISNQTFVDMTGISKGHISRTLKELKARNIVTQSGNKLQFNKDYQGWQKLPDGVTRKKVTRLGFKVTRLGNKKLPHREDTKEKKETIQKKEEKDIAWSDKNHSKLELPFITIPLINKDEYPIYKKDIDEFKDLYPAVNIEQELRNIRGWNLGNPSKRKTKRGIMRHINFWLENKQNNIGNILNKIHSSKTQRNLEAAKKILERKK